MFESLVKVNTGEIIRDVADVIMNSSEIKQSKMADVEMKQAAADTERAKADAERAKGELTRAIAQALVRNGPEDPRELANVAEAVEAAAKEIASVREGTIRQYNAFVAGGAEPNETRRDCLESERHTLAAIQARAEAIVLSNKEQRALPSPLSVVAGGRGD